MEAPVTRATDVALHEHEVGVPRSDRSHRCLRDSQWPPGAWVFAGAVDLGSRLTHGASFAGPNRQRGA